MRSASGVRRGLAALAVLVVGVALASAPAAHASSQDRVTVAPGQTVTRSYPAILGVNPVPKEHNEDLNQPGEPDPGTCADLPSCDVIPVTVTQPVGLSVFDTFALRIELRWQGVGASPSDLDLYLWYDPQGDVAAKKSAGSANPEAVVFTSPTSGAFQVVVNNAAGANSGYTLVVTSRYVRGERPSDLDLVPTTRPPLAAALPTGGGPTAVTTAPLQSAPALGVPAGEPLDPDLGNLTAAGRAPDIFKEASGSARRHRPVSGASIALWAGLFPILAAAAVGAVLYRRRPHAMR
jgi:hypothetical protein